MSISIQELAKTCKESAKTVAQLSSRTKAELLKDLARELLDRAETVIAANRIDMEQARKKGLSEAMIDRLVLDSDRIRSMSEALIEIAKQEDPVGKLTAPRVRPNGIRVQHMSIPLGVIAIIYESRPNVTIDAAALCLKAGNSVILRGGSEAFHSNKAIVDTIHRVLGKWNLPTAAVSFVSTTEREAMVEMLKLEEYIDLVIPRGGEGLIRFVSENSRIPVIKHYKGVCHLFVDAAADLEAALEILVDGKVSRPGVCNALETLLVHDDIAQPFFRRVADNEPMRSVEIRGCEITQKLLAGSIPVVEADYEAEFLSKIIAVKVVENLQAAIDHINTYTSDHTEVIVTDNMKNAEAFVRLINSAVVMVNASSRFSDGGELGLGAEIGISTTKLHAYGPMGAESLTTKKFVVTGSGQTRQVS